MKLKILLFSLFAFCLHDVWSYNLHDAVLATVKNNNQIQIAMQKLQVAILEKPKARAEFLPNVSAQLIKNLQNTKELSVGLNKIPAMKYHQNSLTLAIEQDIFSGGSTMAKIAIADANINAAYAEYNKALNDVIYETIRVYESVLSIREQVRLQEQNVIMAERILDKATVTVRSGAETKTSLFLAKAALAEIKSNLEDYKAQKIQLEQYFQYYTGEEISQELENIDTREYPTVSSLKNLENLVMQKNPDIIVAKNYLDASKHSMVIANSALIPKVKFSAIFSKQDYSDSTPSSSIAPDGNTYRVSLSIPIFNNGIEYINILEAKEKNKQYRYGLSDIINRVKAQMVSTWNKYKSSNSIYLSASTAETNYYKTYLSAQTEFEVGAKTVSDVISKQRDYTNSSINRSRKKQDSILAFFEVHKLIGNLSEVISKKK